MKQLLTELFEAYYKDVYSYLFSLCRDASLAEDLTSEVFLEVVKSIASFRGESDIKTWLFSIARHRWSAYLHRQSRRIRTQSIHDLYDAAAPASDPDGAAEAIRKLLSQEPPLTQAVVQLRIEGYSYYEIAQKHHICENSARVIYFRAKSKLRKQLEKEGFPIE